MVFYSKQLQDERKLQTISHTRGGKEKAATGIEHARQMKEIITEGQKNEVTENMKAIK